MIISTDRPEFYAEFYDLAKLFGVGEDNDDEFFLYHHEEQVADEIQSRFEFKRDNVVKEYTFNYKIDTTLTPLRKKSYRKRQAQNQLYTILNKELGFSLPWGSLTGVRPTKFARDLISYGEIKHDYLVPELLNRDYFVSINKSKLVWQILKNQRGIIRNDNLIDLYVNIPICPTRCVYCSFISSELSKVCSLVDKYIDCLIKEIECVKEIIRKKSYIVRNIYIGGGTPSVLTVQQLEKLLGVLNFPVNEFTVECGRPDTITPEKLDVLKKHGVTRISINPQTFCEATLKRIGRKQKNIQVLEAYTYALERDFVVNMDIIAGLPGEKLGIFKRTLNTLLELQPHNITVHTLSIKNGSDLSASMQKVDDKDVENMVNFAEETLMKNGYKPYYLYRQKNQLKGLENVGYYRDDHICMFNIESMEETNTIIGVGAGAISKRVFNLERKLERLPNVKFIEDYIARHDEMLEKKREFFK